MYFRSAVGGLHPTFIISWMSSTPSLFVVPFCLSLSLFDLSLLTSFSPQLHALTTRSGGHPPGRCAHITAKTLVTGFRAQTVDTGLDGQLERSNPLQMQPEFMRASRVVPAGVVALEVRPILLLPPPPPSRRL